MNIVSAEGDKRISMFLLQVLGEAEDQVSLVDYSLIFIYYILADHQQKNLIKMMRFIL